MIMTPDYSQLLCFFATAASLYIFVRVAPACFSSPSERRQVRERNRLIGQLNRRAQTNAQVASATALSMALIWKGSGRLLFISGGFGLAVAVVSGGCPTAFQFLVETLGKALVK